LVEHDPREALRVPALPRRPDVDPPEDDVAPRDHHRLAAIDARLARDLDVPGRLVVLCHLACLPVIEPQSGPRWPDTTDVAPGALQSRLRLSAPGPQPVYHKRFHMRRFA